MQDNDPKLTISFDPGAKDSIYTLTSDGKLEPPEKPKADEEPIGEAYGPRRRAPHYYVGETYGGRMRGMPKVNQGRYAKGAGRPINYPDVERHPNGAIAGIRNKLARRVIRGRLKKANSVVEARIARARHLRADVYAKADSPREGKRWYEKTLSLHKPVLDVDSRALRTAFRKAKRAEAKKLGIHVRELETNIVKQLADKVYGGE